MLGRPVGKKMKYVISSDHPATVGVASADDWRGIIRSSVPLSRGRIAIFDSRTGELKSIKTLDDDGMVADNRTGVSSS